MTDVIGVIAIAAVPVLFAITAHEAAHGWMAKQLGDPTAQMLGRLTLNPLRHIDPVGTVLVPLATLFLSGFIFGWAKPVPVTWENLRHPRRDSALVALAGPGANAVMAVMWLVLAGLSGSVGDYFGQPLYLMAEIGFIINIVLMLLNMLPILPLDGGRVLSAMLPGPWAWKLSRLEPYGLIILLLLLVSGLLSWIVLVPGLLWEWIGFIK